ncbi:MAG TPA: hypothetical protein PKN86_03790 [Candidatus Obscuribacter sp.]|nr:hypothetical protein [Candidatus Obscuribacter sp.]HMW89000.1 hypothetical protein [Candidatus Obscuribacter sp.]HNB15386.1 hypothetical protein [Candidatus Obscuribacter sp.]HNG73985.1 hypothetical protein [Candidatus Obscuribacter sp.]HNM48793.1 hypothetical protein [Candidatus Obscuribacter sp.]
MTRTRVRVKDHGQVKHLELPPGWTPCPEDQRTSGAYLKEFRSQESEDVKLSFYYRGQRIPRVAAEEFQNILAHDAHELTTEELEQVEIVIRNASDEEYFSLSSSHTEDINGKRILIVEGVWKTSGLADYGLFIDSDNTGSAVQEIHFLAPERDYVNYIDQIEQVLASIVWK